MLAHFRSRAKYRPFRRVSLSTPHDDDIPLSQMTTTVALQDSLYQDNNEGDQQVRSRGYLVCYLLHAFFVVLHFVLLAFKAALHHPERRIVILSASEVFTIGLSGGLQAFYTLYTALLVFVTQRLVLTTVFSGPTKLTQIHDICGAWCGLGAALSTLWQQTKVTSSVFSISLVMLYFIGVSVLHVASSTIMQFQPFNASVTSTVSAVATWPHPLSIFTSNTDAMASISSIAPYMQDLYGNATTGLVNNTLYDIPVPAFVNATVNATTLNAHCGLLTNILDFTVNNASYSVTVGPTRPDSFTFSFDTPPLPNEIWFLPSSNVYPPGFIAYLVSAAIEVDASVSGTDYLYINGTFSPPDSVAQNFTTPTYLVACTFNTTSTTAILGTSGVQLDSDKQQTSTTWPEFSSDGDGDLTNAILSLITNDESEQSPYCLPILTNQYWKGLSSLDAYVASALQVGLSTCGNTSIEQYTGTPYFLTRDLMENVTSRIAAEFVWLAGQWGEVAGGFDRQREEAQITEYVLKWRLNINLLPVITSFCASVVLCILVACMFWGRDGQQEIIPAAGMLEIMWFGSRSSALRDHLGDVQDPSVDVLRASSMFEAILWTRSADLYQEQEMCGPHATIPLYGAVRYSSSSKTQVAFRRDRNSDRNFAAVSSTDAARFAEGFLPEQPTGNPSNTPRSRLWCNALHIVLVFLHIVLLSLLVRHPEHSVIIPIESSTMTVGLTALSQAVYTLYTALLVFALQRAAISKIISERQNLTTVHDVSGSWTGIGAAILVIWQQRNVNSSLRQVMAAVIYLTSMLVLHVASSSVIQWQAFNAATPSGIQLGLALPDSAMNISNMTWSDIFPVVQVLMGQDSNLSTYGLLNNTLFDVPQVPENAMVNEATVNATTLKVQCGLVPNLVLLSQQYDNDGLSVVYRIGFSLNGTINSSFTIQSMMKNIVHGVEIQCTDCPQTLFYTITTAIDVDESVNDSALKLNWTYVSSEDNNTRTENLTTLTYISACSVSAHTIPVVLDLQSDRPDVPLNQTALSTNTSWSVWSPIAPTNIGVGIASALGSSWEPTTQAVSPEVTNHSVLWSLVYTDMDNLVMSLLGLNLTATIDAPLDQSSTGPSVMLTPAELENVVGQIAAVFLWVAGQLGERNGGFTRTVRESQAMQDVQQWRLNLNTVPIVFASIASFIALVVSMIVLGRKPVQEYPTSVSGTSVLESFWLVANSEEIRSRLQAVTEPYPDKLREAGMFPIRLGDVTLGSCQASESEATTLNNDPVDDFHSMRGMNESLIPLNRVGRAPSDRSKHDRL